MDAGAGTDAVRVGKIEGRRRQDIDSKVNERRGGVRCPTREISGTGEDRLTTTRAKQSKMNAGNRDRVQSSNNRRCLCLLMVQGEVGEQGRDDAEAQRGWESSAAAFESYIHSPAAVKVREAAKSVKSAPPSFPPSLSRVRAPPTQPGAPAKSVNVTKKEQSHLAKAQEESHADVARNGQEHSTVTAVQRRSYFGCESVRADGRRDGARSELEETELEDGTWGSGVRRVETPKSLSQERKSTVTAVQPRSSVRTERDELEQEGGVKPEAELGSTIPLVADGRRAAVAVAHGRAPSLHPCIRAD
ncbi:hypothetical protein C8R45DRAFT_1071393 [Mycena sanguinolenta]|nr:hypothetical protein C8R45DRAFT_1071393 [Mycena sanguinolenta]